MNRISRASCAAALIGALWLASPASGGPPLVCFPYEIGGAKCLAWGRGSHDIAKGYARERVVDDTLAILKTAETTLLRMETLRRATVYLREDQARATELLSKLGWMALDAEAADNTEWARRAWFDAGFLAACYHQSGVDIDWKPGVSDGLQGWAWIRKAIDVGADDPAVFLAAALVLQEKNDGSHTLWLARAVRATEAGSDLARTIEANAAFGEQSFEELRAALGAGDARPRAAGR